MPGSVGTAIDLGCGPGATTELLRLATQADQVIGIDSASDALELARRRYPDLTFIRHDVVTEPWPARADVAFGRFLLSHIPGPNACLERWLTQLEPEGRLFIDELHHIEPRHPALSAYIEISCALVASGGATMEVGRELAPPDGSRLIFDDVASHPVPNPIAAGWFLHNAREVWPKRPWVREHIPMRDQARLVRELEQIDDSGESRWFMRRMVIEPAAAVT